MIYKSLCIKVTLPGKGQMNRAFPLWDTELRGHLKISYLIDVYYSMLRQWK